MTEHIIELSVADAMVERAITVSLLDELVFVLVSDDAPLCVRLSHGHRVIEVQFVRAESRRWSAVIAGAQLMGACEVSEWTVEVRVELPVKSLLVPMPYRELSPPDQTTYHNVMVGRVVLIDSRRRSLTRVVAVPAVMIGILATVIVACGFASSSGWMVFWWSVLVAPALAVTALRFERVRETPWWRSRVAVVASLSVFSLAVFMQAINRTTWVRAIDESAVTRARFGRAGTSKLWFAHELTEMESELAAKGLRVVPYRTADRCAREHFGEPMAGSVVECPRRWGHVSLAAQQELGISSSNLSGATDCVDLAPRGCGLTAWHPTPFGRVHGHALLLAPPQQVLSVYDGGTRQAITRAELIVRAAGRTAMFDAIPSDFGDYTFDVWGDLRVRAVRTVPLAPSPTDAMIWTMAETSQGEVHTRFSVRTLNAVGWVRFELLLSGGERVQVDCLGGRTRSIDVYPFRREWASELQWYGAQIDSILTGISTVATCRVPEESRLSQRQLELRLGRVTAPALLPGSVEASGRVTEPSLETRLLEELAREARPIIPLAHE